MNSLLSYLKKLDNIHTSPPVSTHEPFLMGKNSPYKPTLLLVIFQGIQQGIPEFSKGEFTLDNCKTGLRAIYSALNRHADLDTKKLDAMCTQPFWYLGAGRPKLFCFTPCPGMAAELEQSMNVPIKQIKTSRALNRLVQHAAIPSADFSLLKERLANMAICGFLVSRYFPEWETNVHSGLKQLREYWNNS